MVTILTAAYPVIGDLNLSATDDLGVDWITESVTGWGSPGGTLAPAQKPRSAGEWAGDSFLKGRSIVLKGTTIAPDAVTASIALDRLIDAVSLAPTLLSITEGDRTRSMMVRRDGEILVTWFGDTAFQWSVQLFAPDGRKLSAPIVVSTGLPTSSGGLTIPFTVPFTIDAATVTGQVTIVNPGNTTGAVVLRIDGPIGGPVITHVGSGAPTIWASSWVGGAGEFLIVDMEKRTVLANGQAAASRNNTITSRGWFGLDPGLNTFSFSANTFDPAALLTVTATPSGE